METWKKIALGTVITTALVGGTVYVVQINRTSAELQTVPIAKIDKLDLKGLTIRVDVQLKNPTRTAFKIKFPFIKLVYKNTTVGSSQAIDKDITIPAFGEAVVEKILIQIPLTNLFSMSGSLIRGVQANEAVKIDVTTISVIDLGWKKMPYSNTDTITLGKKQA